MTTQQQPPRGRLSEVSFEADATVYSDVLVPRQYASAVAFYVRASEAGTAVLQYAADDGTFEDLRSSAAVLPEDFWQQHLLRQPIRGVRLKYTNTSSAPGTLTVNVAEGGP
ncbi:MAG: hypothetical protein HY791_02935 [Deltaproteobacteria bacterium]|nr:hypothetical protein [Deltaproteobacteria bacterium]